jgi:hypothetical protein
MTTPNGSVEFVRDIDRSPAIDVFDFFYNWSEADVYISSQEGSHVLNGDDVINFITIPDALEPDVIIGQDSQATHNVVANPIGEGTVTETSYQSESYEYRLLHVPVIVIRHCK